MSAFEDYKDELEHFEQMFGRERGRLAVSLDRLTNALVLIGQHGVYCTSQRNPTVPAMDIRIVAQELAHAKELVQSVMEELRQAKENARQARGVALAGGLLWYQEWIRVTLFADRCSRPVARVHDCFVRKLHQFALERGQNIFHGASP